MKEKLNKKRSLEDSELEKIDEDLIKTSISLKRELDEETANDDDENPRKKFEQEDFDDWRFVESLINLK